MFLKFYGVCGPLQVRGCRKLTQVGSSDACKDERIPDTVNNEELVVTVEVVLTKTYT